MAGAEKEDGRRAAVEVVDRDVPVSGWQQIDLPQVAEFASAAGRPGRASPRAAASLLSFPRRPAKPLTASAPTQPKRIPVEALVEIGRPGPALLPRKRYPKRGPAAAVSANDNVAQPVATARSMWRDLFFLAILAATVAGAFWSGRVHGLQKVIVVPGPSSFYSVVT